MLMQKILRNEFTAAQVAAFLMGLCVKRESNDELCGAADATRELAVNKIVELPHFVNVANTGCATPEIFNLSVATAFVAAAAGCYVAVHDGSPFIKNSRNADLLRAFGIKISTDFNDVFETLSSIGLGFTVGNSKTEELNLSVSRELGFNNLFNLMATLSGPFLAQRHFVGVKCVEQCKQFAELHAHLGSEHALIVHGAEGLDAISLSGKTIVAEWRKGELLEYEITPESFGIQSKSLMGLNQTEIEDEHLLIKDALGNRRGHYAEKAADMITLNAGAVIYTSGLADSLKQGVSIAREVIANSRAGDKIRQASTNTN